MHDGQDLKKQLWRGELVGDYKMGFFNSSSRSSKSRFEAEMEQVAQQLPLAFGKIQEGMRTYLLKYLEANSIPVDNQAVEKTFFA